MSFQKYLEDFDKQAEVIDPDQTYPTTLVVETIEDVPKADDITTVSAPRQISARNVMQHPDAHPIVLTLLMLKMYGPEWLEWDAETLPLQIPRDFPGQTLSHLNLNKLMATKTLQLVDTYWQQWEVFMWCSMGFTGVFPNFEVMQVPTAAQALLSVATANRIRHDVEWSTEMKGYLQTVFLHDGVFKAPAPLAFLELDATEYGISAPDLDRAINQRAGPQSEQMKEQVRRYYVLQDLLTQEEAELNAQLKWVDRVAG